MSDDDDSERKPQANEWVSAELLAGAAWVPNLPVSHPPARRLWWRVIGNADISKFRIYVSIEAPDGPKE